MIHVDEQELLRRDAKCIEKAEIYKNCVFALEIYRAKYDRFLAEVKMEIRKSLEGKVSETELERIALSSARWGSILSTELEKLEQAGRAKIEFQVAVQSYEAMRSALSSRKTEIGKGL